MDIQLLKLDEVTARLAIGQTHLYELLGRGELASVKIGRSRRVRSDVLEQFVTERSADCLAGD